MNEKIENAMLFLAEQATLAGVTSAQALQFTQAAANLANAGRVLAEVKLFTEGAAGPE